MLVAKTSKLGRSVDVGDLLAERKRNILNQVIASQKAAGTYKPNLSNRSFEMINLQRQVGLDSELISNSNTVTPVQVTFTIIIPSGITIELNTTGITSVSWGDDSTVINEGAHTYASGGTYVIELEGTFTKFPSNDSFSPYITNVASFVGITDMSGMFYGANIFNQDIGSWDVSNVTNILSMFTGSGMSSTVTTNYSNQYTKSQSLGQALFVS